MEAQRALVTPDTGELLFTTDLHEIFVGDGATAGGLFVGGGSGTGYVPKLRGTQAIASGVSTVTVSGLALASVPAQVLVSVRKPTDGLSFFASVRSDTITTAGFTADLSGITDAGTYALDWLVIL